MGGYLFLTAAGLAWIAFGCVLVTRPALLDEAWGTVRSLPLAAKPFIWIAFLPWLVGLAAWESNWRSPRARMLLVLLIAGAWMAFWTSATGDAATGAG